MSQYTGATTSSPTAGLAEGLQIAVYGKPVSTWYAEVRIQEGGAWGLSADAARAIKERSDELWGRTICGTSIDYDAFVVGRRAAAADYARRYGHLPDFLGTSLDEYQYLREIGNCLGGLVRQPDGTLAPPAQPGGSTNNTSSSSGSSGGSAVWWVLGGAAGLWALSKIWQVVTE